MFTLTTRFTGSAIASRLIVDFSYRSRPQAGILIFFVMTAFRSTFPESVVNAVLHAEIFVLFVLAAFGPDAFEIDENNNLLPNPWNKFWAITAVEGWASGSFIFAYIGVNIWMMVAIRLMYSVYMDFTISPWITTSVLSWVALQIFQETSRPHNWVVTAARRLEGITNDIDWMVNWREILVEQYEFLRSSPHLEVLVESAGRVWNIRSSQWKDLLEQLVQNFYRSNDPPHPAGIIQFAVLTLESIKKLFNDDVIMENPEAVYHMTVQDLPACLRLQCSPHEAPVQELSVIRLDRFYPEHMAVIVYTYTSNLFSYLYSILWSIPQLFLRS